MASFTVDIRGNASHLEKAIGLAKNRLGDLANSAKFGVTALAGLGAAGAAGLGAFIISSSKAASNVESLTMQFETLLGSTSAAKARMEEIVKFAADTPFEIAELAATSKLLQVMGGTLLATGQGLRMVGDAAAISGQPIGEVGLHIGRLFNAITTGNSAGESVSRLQELGLMTGTVKKEFEELAAAQKKGKAHILNQEQAMIALREVFKSADGAMQRLATTTEGKTSNMKDSMTSLQVAFGAGFNVGLKDALDGANTFLPKLTAIFTQTGEVMGAAITESMAGNNEKFALLGAAAGELIVAGLNASVIAGLDNLGTLLGKGLAYSAENLSGLAVVAPEQAKKVGAKIRDFTSSGTTFREQIDSAMAKPSVTSALEKVNIEAQVMRGIKTGVQENMSEAVKRGVLEAMSRQPGGAKFSN
jgi:hypothetical protein